jgi:hypothetical protein
VLIENLEVALEETQSKQGQLTSEIETLQRGLVVKEKEPPQNPIVARNTITVFYAPYFKVSGPSLKLNFP